LFKSLQSSGDPGRRMVHLARVVATNWRWAEEVRTCRAACLRAAVLQCYNTAAVVRAWGVGGCRPGLKRGSTVAVPVSA
jgi:hypothetical protein